MPENRAELPVHGMEMYAAGKGNASTSLSRSLLGQAMLISPANPVSPLGSSGVAGGW